ncbi:hypothetical protein F4809DRAFT_663126 [Biscogniauxia mediterranea]|nr:hypothetical protein F4809DRAFT_663126 [Biscogniauxia mediterranea]
MLDGSLTMWTFSIIVLVLLAYLIRVNQLLSQTPDELRKLSGPRWSPEQLRETYKRLQNNPISYKDKLPPRLHRRYIVTGGSGLVGGFIVEQLLARGTPAGHIRILDIRRPERDDAADEVDFAHTDITSRASVDAAFARPWPPDAARLPLTVFHTAAVILASERSAARYAFPEAVNVGGTRNVLGAARRSGADVFSATSSASVAIRPVRPLLFPLSARERANFWQVLDERDFFAPPPPRPRERYFGNYPASKAAAERIVCEADGEGFRTGCIRPANGVYGNPTDNTVGDPLSRDVLPTWIPHIIQPFVHGINVALAHLQHESALLHRPPSSSSPLCSGRPFVVTDPNPPIAYADLYAAISTLSAHPFAAVRVPPAAALLLAHALELYDDLALQLRLPPLRGDARLLKPGLFSICTHLVAADAAARRPVADGGLGYEGAVRTLDGVVAEVLAWNREHGREEAGWEEAAKGRGKGKGERKAYTTSIALADKIQKSLGLGGR